MPPWSCCARWLVTSNHQILLFWKVSALWCWCGCWCFLLFHLAVYSIERGTERASDKDREFLSLWVFVFLGLCLLSFFYSYLYQALRIPSLKKIFFFLKGDLPYKFYMLLSVKDIFGRVVFPILVYSLVYRSVNESSRVEFEYFYIQARTWCYTSFLKIERAETM